MIHPLLPATVLQGTGRTKKAARHAAVMATCRMLDELGLLRKHSKKINAKLRKKQLPANQREKERRRRKAERAKARVVGGRDLNGLD